jgi:competence ComEA-like helix-hairpin-helix protein
VNNRIFTDFEIASGKTIHENTRSNDFVRAIRVISWIVSSVQRTKLDSNRSGNSEGRGRMMPIGALCFWRKRTFHWALLLLALLLSLPACVRRPRVATSSNNEQQSAIANQQASRRININVASANELETLPGIGKGLAARIIEHRTEYGPFRRPEHLIMVRGISDQRFRALQDLITVE